MRNKLRLASIAAIAALFFAAPASAQNVNCPLVGGIIGNCVPIVELPPTSTLLGVGAGSTGAVTATLTSSTGHLAYLCSFDISALGGTATVGPVTVTGLAQTLTYQLAATASGNVFVRSFKPCLPASATGTNIVITTTADGSASAVDVNAAGFLQ
jgi:hypothetical protein